MTQIDEFSRFRVSFCHLHLHHLCFIRESPATETTEMARRVPSWRWTALALLVMCVASELIPAATAVGSLAAPAWQVRGEVGDAACNVEEVETANEQQLHEILAELTNTTYFRLFQVDLSRKCKFWNKNKPQVRAPPAPARCRPREGERCTACASSSFFFSSSSS